MIRLTSSAAVLSLLSLCCSAQQFTVAGGQIFTPGFVVVDAPQPGTPLGGDTLHLALDITANGKLNQPPYILQSPSLIHNITIFLYSYATGRNFTVANAALPGGGSTSGNQGDILDQEPGSTVKHVNWVWPDCLVGDGQPKTVDSARGVYNISIRQSFRLNHEEYYTIFDLPISVTNRIDEMSSPRPSCDVLNNPMMSPEQINAESANTVGVLFAPGDETKVDFLVGGSDPDNGLGGSRPEAQPQDGLGNGAISLQWSAGLLWLSVTSLGMLFTL